MTYQIYTLGCKVNEYESEVIADILEKNGYKKNDRPDICIVNTCTVTNTADSKSRKIIRSLKRKYPNCIMVVVGCLIQNSIKKTDDLDIDIAIGNKDKTKIVDYIKEYKNKQIKKIYNISDMDFENMQIEKFKLTRAYIKIQDGCDNYCSFCIIPYVRGHVRSKAKENVIKEAQALVKNGHKEIVLTGIHTGNYHDQNYTFSDLLNDLIKIKGLERLRISSIEMNEIDKNVLEILKQSPILVNHMHIPIQSGSNKILKAMNRKYNIEQFKEKIEKIRKIRPNMNLTTDVIVGFPGETDELFTETIKTLKEIKFTKLHVFPYSKREGTKAAKMENQVDEKIKKERVKTLLELSKKQEKEYAEKFINKKGYFLPEIYKDGYLIGHTENYLLIKAKGPKKFINKIIKVKNIELDYPYIIGKIES